MIFEHTNYRSFLKTIISDKKKKNPSYSMNALALQVGLGQSALSQVLAGKKNLSMESANRIANKLALTEVESEYFKVIIQIEVTKDFELKKSLLARAQSLNPIQEVRELSVDFFSTIADWYHLAIKNMIGLEGFTFTSAAIAKRLGISKLDAEVAIERLIRLEMIELDPKNPNNYRVVKNYTITRSAIPNDALRKFHRQMLEKAIDSLTTQSPQEKIVGSETFAFSPELLPAANVILEDCFRKMTDLAKKSKNQTEVYHLGLQFFNLTKNKT
jgi:uncharacterized protein (TIGR02147 family)